jgi:hypothetical protein
VVEGPILLHENHVLDAVKAAFPPLCLGIGGRHGGDKTRR